MIVGAALWAALVVADAPAPYLAARVAAAVLYVVVACAERAFTRTAA